MSEELQLRIHGDPTLPALVFLPGLHGDWTLVTSFRLALAGRVRFVEFTYPRMLTWSLDDYANAVVAALAAHGIHSAWLVAESFSSQVAWPIIANHKSGFQVEGLVLAGGFVKHPVHWGVCLAGRFCQGVSMTWLTRFLYWYVRFAGFRHRHAPETLASVAEFVARRTELDKQAAKHRIDLVAQSDFRPIAGQTTLPVYFLSGLFDPIVPWPLALLSLRRQCPGYRGCKIIWNADHNVLGTAPCQSADQVLHWMQAGGATRPITATAQQCAETVTP